MSEYVGNNYKLLHRLFEYCDFHGQAVDVFSELNSCF